MTLGLVFLIALLLGYLLCRSVHGHLKAWVAYMDKQVETMERYGMRERTDG